MVNMAGGVMENAGLCLDRFGLPCIPGSAVKGCSRRAALAALREWCETGQQPGPTEGDKDNLFKAACQDFTSPAALLVATARVFGWCEQDWKSESDFAWACGEHWREIWKATAEKVAADFRWVIPEKQLDAPWKALPNFAGCVSFLPAYPVDLGKTGKMNGLPLEVPQLGKLELDVVTCHHGKYYAEPDRAKNPREWEEWNRKWGAALDTEEPVPVVFPTVASGHVFAFALAILRGGDEALLGHARAWLVCGLQTFGVGAKTNAGYGWFDVGEQVELAVHGAITEVRRRQQEGLARQQDEEQRKAQQERRRREAAELKAATADMTAEQKADYELKDWDDNRLKNHFDRFAKLTPEQQGAVYRLLRGSRMALWLELKKLALEGKAKERSRWGAFTSAMFTMAKQRGEKMP